VKVDYEVDVTVNNTVAELVAWWVGLTAISMVALQVAKKETMTADFLALVSA